jgi:hypothetical protein
MDMNIYSRQYTDSTFTFEPAMLYLNNQDNTFEPLELPILNRSFMAMGLNFADIDNDGFLDVYMGTGYTDLASIVPNILLYNDHGKGFIDISLTSNTGHLQKGHGISFFDYEKDGDLDIYESMDGFYPIDQFDNVLFQNTGNSNNWIGLKLVGRTSTIGTKIQLDLEDTQKIYRELNSGGSYGSSPLEKVVGLGQTDEIVRIKITWMNGSVQVIDSPAINQ